MREAINNAISEEMKKNKNVIIFGEEVGEYQGAYKVTQGLLKQFGNKRVIDTPISEEGFTGLAIGCAFNGLIPIVGSGLTVIFTLPGLIPIHPFAS